MLTKEQILKHRPATHREVKALGGVVRLRAMTTGERDLFEQRYVNLPEDENGIIKNLRAFYIMHSIVDEDNNLMFCVDDLDSLSELPFDGMNKIFKAVQELNGDSDEDMIELEKK